MQRSWGLLAAILLLQSSTALAQRFMQLPVSAPCYTGVAQLSMRDDNCRRQMAPMTKLSAPFDPQEHLPWDCLDSMAVSVEGCMVNMVSMVNMSDLVLNFSCSWIQWQGNIVNGSAARIAAWTRPAAVARYILRNTDLAIVSNVLNANSKPQEWQDMLAESLTEWRAALLADPSKPGMVVLSHNRRGCNSTYEVMEGGIMGVGQVNRSSIGQIVMPSLRPFQKPIIIRGERPRPWLARARAIFIALIVMVSVLGALLLAAVGYLIYRLCTAGKRKAAPMRGSPFEDGISRIETPHQDIGQGVSSLESQARRHGPSGGI